MSYHDTMDRDLQRAREIIKRGVDELHYGDQAALVVDGRVYGADTYDAVKLLESFVQEIERLRAELNTERANVQHLLDTCVPVVELDEARARITQLEELVHPKQDIPAFPPLYPPDEETEVVNLDAVQTRTEGR